MGKGANSNRRNECAQVARLGGRGLHLLSNFAGLKKNGIEKIKK